MTELRRRIRVRPGLRDLWLVVAGFMLALAVNWAVAVVTAERRTVVAVPEAGREWLESSPAGVELLSRTGVSIDVDALFEPQQLRLHCVISAATGLPGARLATVASVAGPWSAQLLADGQVWDSQSQLLTGDGAWSTEYCFPLPDAAALVLQPAPLALEWELTAPRHWDLERSTLSDLTIVIDDVVDTPVPLLVQKVIWSGAELRVHYRQEEPVAEAGLWLPRFVLSDRLGGSWTTLPHYGIDTLDRDRVAVVPHAWSPGRHWRLSLDAVVLLVPGPLLPLAGTAP